MIDVVTLARVRLDRLAVAGGHAQSRTSRPAPIPGPLCYGTGGSDVTS